MIELIFDWSKLNEPTTEEPITFSTLIDLTVDNLERLIRESDCDRVLIEGVIGILKLINKSNLDKPPEITTYDRNGLMHLVSLLYDSIYANEDAAYVGDALDAVISTLGILDER